MSHNTDQPHNHPDIPGGFSSHLNSKPEQGVTLFAKRTPIVLPTTLTFTFDDRNLIDLPLPPYPESLSEPTVTCDFENGPQTYVTVEDRTVIFWSGLVDHNGGETSNSYDDGGDDELADFDEPSRRALIVWGSAVQERTRRTVESMTAQSIEDPKVLAAVVAAATGKPRTFEETDHSVPAPDRAVARATKQLGAWVGAAIETGSDNEEPNREHVADVLSDLLHFCDANGIDFDQALASGTFVYNDEIRDPH